MRYLSSTTPASYDEWLVAFGTGNPDSVYLRYALETVAEHGGTWTVGNDALMYAHHGLKPHTHLTMLERFGLLEQTGADTWTLTASGKALDAGRPNRGNGPRLHRRAS